MFDQKKIHLKSQAEETFEKLDRMCPPGIHHDIQIQIQKKQCILCKTWLDELVQKSRNSSTLAM